MQDFCEREGAERLRTKIQNYWKARRYDVAINLVDAGFLPTMRSARTDVRSDMVNGMPRRRITEGSICADEVRRPDIHLKLVGLTGN